MAERIPWADAAVIAEQLHGELLEVAARVKTVGSVRRRRPEVKDIELLVEPRDQVAGLFGETAPDIDSIRAVLAPHGRFLKNGQRYIQLERPDGLKIDVFLCHPPAEWGSLLAIRTGPAELGQWAVTRLRQRGYRHLAGHVQDERGRVLPTPSEEEFFRLAGLPCLPPSRRGSPMQTPEAYRSDG